MPTLRLPIRDPDRAYVGNMLWLPKKHIAEAAMKAALEYFVVENNAAVTQRLWSETKYHLVCPREFIHPEQYPSFPFPFVDLSPKRFRRTNVWVKDEPRDDTQRRAFSALSYSQGGTLNLACGKGKTFLALKKLEELQVPGLIVVHNTFLMNQWLNEAIPKHMELPPGERVGIIQGPEFDWHHPITIAMIQTLADRTKEGKIPDGFREHFGAVFYDEVHHLSAPLFVQTAPVIPALRYGLTATDKRSDGTDFIYKFHLGGVFYTDRVQSLLPRIYFQKTPVYIDVKEPEVRDVRGELNIPKLRSFAGTHEFSNRFRAFVLQEALDQGRKIIAVSHSKNQLIALHEMFPDSGLVVQETPQADRSRIVRNSKITFAIASLGFEGLDDDTIDTTVALLPFADPGNLEQFMGRGQRQRDDRKAPVFLIFDDFKVGPFKAQCNKMRAAFKEWDKHAPGMPPLAFQNLDIPPGAPTQ